MQINFILYPNNSSLREHAIAFEECIVGNVERIHFESEAVFHNSKISFRKILDLLNIKKIRYSIKQIELSATNNNEVNLFAFAPELNYLLLFFYLKLKFKNVKIWYLMHEPNAITRKVFKGYIVHLYNLMIFKMSSKIILASNHSYNVAKKIFSDSSKMIIINLVFSSKPEAKSLKDLEINNINTKNCFLYYGTGSYGKRPDRLNVISDLLGQMKVSNYKIIRAGLDIFKTNYNNDILVFPEYLEKSKIEKLISECKVIVLPYDFIVQSGIIVEALYHGKIVLASTIEGFLQYSKCEAVLLADFENIKSMEQQVFDLINMSFDDYKSKIDLGQSYFSENHSYFYLKKRLNSYLNLNQGNK